MILKGIFFLLTCDFHRLQKPNWEIVEHFVHYTVMNNVIDSFEHQMDAYLTLGYISYLLQMPHPSEQSLIADLDQRIINQFDLRMCEIRELGLIRESI